MKAQIVFDRPSTRYDEALPIGNGRLGAMVDGGVREKHIFLNEETVWYGGPRDRNNPDALNYMGEIRELMGQGRLPEAERLAVLALTGTPETQRHYSTLGMIVLDFFNHGGEVENYRRVLDMDSALVGESYTIDGIDYELTAMASQPDSVIAVRIKASAPVLSFAVCLERGERVGQFSYGTHMDKIVRIQDEGLVMRGNCGGEDGLIFRGALFASCDQGKKIIGDRLVFDKAQEVVLYVSAGTDFADKDIENTCIKQCQAALDKGFKACYQRHLEEWTELYSTASLSLAEVDALPPLVMNKVFDVYAGGDLSSLGLQNPKALDDYVVSMLFAFGRYALLSCSRNCNLPANLQGIWCRDLLPVWDCKFTANINLQMAYWPADSANLSLCFEPYLNHALRIRENGLVTAQKMYGCRGFVLHNNTDLWADTAVQDAGTHCSYWFLGGVWLAVDMWEHYRYTRDVDFLEQAWPVLRDGLLFVLDFMEERDGELVMGVTTSPENYYISQKGERVSFCQMSAMDSELISLLIKDCLEAMDVLRSHGKAVAAPEDFESLVRDAAKKIRPPRVGRDGTILEWGLEVDEAEPMHRHQSHLIGAFPYNEISQRTPQLFEAVRRSIYKRIENGGANTGWGRAWAAGLLARLGEGSAARDMVASMARHSGLPNLFSCCNIGRIPKLLEDTKPMQLDGNMGAVQAVIEMLLQSHNDEIVFLPALPENWRDGSFSGLVARGNLVVDAWWAEGKLTCAKVRPRSSCDVPFHTGQGYRLRLDDEVMAASDGQGRIQAPLIKDQVYVIEREGEQGC